MCVPVCFAFSELTKRMCFVSSTCAEQASSLRFSAVFTLSAVTLKNFLLHIWTIHSFLLPLFPPTFLFHSYVHISEKWKSSRKWRTQTSPVSEGWWALSGLHYSRMVKAGSAGLSGHPQVVMATGPKRWITRRDRQTGNWTDCNWQKSTEKGKGGKMV